MKPSTRKDLVVCILIVGALCFALLIFLFIRNREKEIQVNRPRSIVTAEVLTQLKRISGISSDQFYVDNDTRLKLLIRIKSTLEPTNSTGKAKVNIFYFGAEYCPYCATMRWPLLIALLRFGDFNSLYYLRSSAVDRYPNTISFSFYGTKYTSSYITFVPVEAEDRNRRILQKPTQNELSILERYDDPPYTESFGAMPFLYTGGQFINIGGPFSPSLLAKHSWRQVIKQLTNIPNSELSYGIFATANEYTKAICELTKDKPANICDKLSSISEKHLL